ncbi:O-antigen ligase family protein [Pontibacter cellulosilyticus]|uniref:O-antigen ligase family protein n=1 Tax=Pontibacter cellulosilyticus TaxID=1720253 RepID=A0A923SME6_9BACT|nr:O-antigen ligase family protein [Pontibacter cellulosilyticus]MBC5992110.1 O-antigen ligase family protein [Pontibacter cellulosilyticus]
MMQTKHLRISTSMFLLKSLIIILLSNGFITNFLSFSGINSGTLIIDLIVIIITLHFIISLANLIRLTPQFNITYATLFLLWLFLIFATLTKTLFFDHNPISERLLGIRNNIIYSIPLFYIPVVFRDDKKIEEILSFFIKVSLVLIVFSYFQFAFSAILPESLLALKGDSPFGFYGSTIVRPTALLGNTIIYSSFTVIVFSLVLAKYLYSPERKYLIMLVMIAIANALTLTRAALVGLIIVLIVALILRYARFTYTFIKKVVGFALLSLFIFSSVIFLYRDSFFLARMAGKDPNSKGSNQEHFQQINDAFTYVLKHPIIGAGVGTQGPSGDAESKIITDGYWLQLLLENGILLGFFYATFYGLCLLFSLLTFYRTDNILLKQLSMAFICFSCYFYAASLLNSAFIGRINFIVYWTIIGLIIAQNWNLKRDRTHA